MTQYNNANIKFTNLQLNKLKQWIKNDTDVNLSSNVLDDSNDETYFPYKLLSNFKASKCFCK